MPDYIWDFTGDPFVDGIITGGGISQGTANLMIILKCISIVDCIKIEKSFRKCGLETGFFHAPVTIAGPKKVALHVKSVEKIFTNMGKLKERRFDINGTNKKFLIGYLMGGATVYLKENALAEKIKRSEGISFKKNLNETDMSLLLNKLGIKKFQANVNKYHVKTEDIDKIEPFYSLFNNYVTEFMQIHQRKPLLIEPKNNREKELFLLKKEEYEFYLPENYKKYFEACRLGRKEQTPEEKEIYNQKRKERRKNRTPEQRERNSLQRKEYREKRRE